ncbi:uncharacterized protein LOC122049159 [Zingiber officinale]|uniref:Uncharacterized protein n=1 Tax=Zingiber officinale TaxID=94328 RepID=A0A8J5LLB1_ZINOF|nr:uncharacterized protein LOC122049159 [Zingiber officinale]KAG6524132.1 hypothetical protein ZIOFF_014023 [Zingiber officinale]
MESSSGSSGADSLLPIPNPIARRAKKRSKKKGAEAMGMEAAWPRRSRPGGGVTLEGYMETAEGADPVSDGAVGVGRTRSLTDDDLDELKGCLDLGFGFSYEEIPELCGTLPALELCYSMSRSLEVTDDASSSAQSSAQPPVANWRISRPGDDPEEVKARLKYWAQAVACTVKLCC